MFREIPLNVITCEKLPLNPEGFATARNWVKYNLRNKPIKVIQQKDGLFRVKDGRHRYLAAKLNGEKTMKVKVLYKE